MNKIHTKILSIIFLCFSFSAYALNANKVKTSEYVLKITSNYSQSFFGTYMVDGKLIAINQQTPFKTTFKAKEVRLMMGTDRSKGLLTVELFKKNNEHLSPLSRGTGHSIFICDSNISMNGKNGCADVSVLAG